MTKKKPKLSKIKKYKSAYIFFTQENIPISIIIHFNYFIDYNI